MSTVFIVNVSRFKNFALHKFTVTAGADRTPEWGGGGKMGVAGSYRVG